MDPINLNQVNARPLSSTSLAETTAQYILDAICDGKITSDDAFPSQYQLCEWFDVSRTVIRESMQILASKGILTVTHGKRTVIRPPSHEHIAESVSLAFRRNRVSLLDVLELRKVLEVEVVSYAARRATEEDIDKLKTSIDMMEEHLNEMQGYVDADVAFHRAIFAAAKQPAFDLVVSSLNDFLLESRKFSYQGTERTLRAIAAHRKIMTAIENHDEIAAKEAMNQHLQETEEDLKIAASSGKQPYLLI